MAVRTSNRAAPKLPESFRSARSCRQVSPSASAVIAFANCSGGGWANRKKISTAAGAAPVSSHAPPPKSCKVKGPAMVRGVDFMPASLGLNWRVSSAKTYLNTPSKLLPGQALTADGRARLDYASIAALAFPFMMNSSVQAILNATDTWFISRISPAATAAIGAVYWPVLAFVLLFGGIGLSVQTVVAQRYGGHRYARASQAAWTAVWASAFTLPLFIALGLLGDRIFAPFGIAPGTERLALDYWYPRMLGAPLGIALWSILGFFNGVGRPLTTLRITACVAVANAFFNQSFVVVLRMGIAGSAWATDAAQLLGLILGLTAFLGRSTRARFRSHLTLRLRASSLVGQFKLGVPMGVLYAADIMGFALFQLMQVRLGNVDGASTQIVMMLTSFCYMPAVGISMAGTTLVGQAVGAKTLNWAARVGDGIIAIAVGYMGLSGLLLAAAGPWVMPLFTNPTDPDSAAVVARGCLLLWIAGAYQLLDGLNLSSSGCLRGAGDVRVPSLLVIALSWGCFVPLAHMLSFKSGEGWVEWLPQFGLGAVGGWFAALAYICALGVALFWRWRSGAWRRMVL
jgi:MATE family multidrug resistance protein